MTHFASSIRETQLEKIKRLFPDYDTTPLIANYNLSGRILTIQTENLALIDVLQREAMIEDGHPVGLLRRFRKLIRI